LSRIYDGRRHVQSPAQFGHHVPGKRIFIHAVNDIHVVTIFMPNGIIDFFRKKGGG